jgi:hypothetical protein
MTYLREPGTKKFLIQKKPFAGFVSAKSPLKHDLKSFIDKIYFKSKKVGAPFTLILLLHHHHQHRLPLIP